VTPVNSADATVQTSRPVRNPPMRAARVGAPAVSSTYGLVGPPLRTRMIAPRIVAARVILSVPKRCR
jgi:hypothetical protein